MLRNAFAGIDCWVIIKKFSGLRSNSSLDNGTESGLFNTLGQPFEATITQLWHNHSVLFESRPVAMCIVMSQIAMSINVYM